MEVNVGSETFPRPGVLVMWSWGGETRQPVEVVGETPKRYRIRALHRTKIGGRNRWLERGDKALVPKGAVRFE